MVGNFGTERMTGIASSVPAMILARTVESPAWLVPVRLTASGSPFGTGKLFGKLKSFVWAGGFKELRSGSLATSIQVVPAAASSKPCVLDTAVPFRVFPLNIKCILPREWVNELTFKSRRKNSPLAKKS